MNCPVDHTALRVIKRGDFTLTACDTCSGLWLTRDTLKQAFASRQPPEKLDESETQPPLLQPARTRHCPSCQCPLAARWLHRIEIDVCQQCQGVWLDAGELRQVIERYQQRKHPGTSPSGPALGSKVVSSHRESKWYDGLDFPCDANFLTAIGSGLGDLASSGADASKVVAEFLGEALSLLDW